MKLCDRYAFNSHNKKSQIHIFIAIVFSYGLNIYEVVIYFCSSNCLSFKYKNIISGAITWSSVFKYKSVFLKSCYNWKAYKLNYYKWKVFEWMRSIYYIKRLEGILSLKKSLWGNTLVGQWLRCYTFTVKDTGSIPGWGTKIP